MARQRTRHLRSVACTDPLAELWEWQMRGACRDLDSSMFFHPEHEYRASRASRDCRRHALTAREPYGVWGALTERERADLVRDRSDA